MYEEQLAAVDVADSSHDGLVEQQCADRLPAAPDRAFGLDVTTLEADVQQASGLSERI